MKRALIFTLFMVVAGATFAQNLQIHYDALEDREYFTTTLEMFKPDEYGATFWFVDMDYDYRHDGYKSASLSYLEIARYVNLPVDKFSATVQYNDGIVDGFPLGPIWLFGVSYPIDLGFITLNTDLLYRTAYNSDAPDAQLTVVWFKDFLEGKITFGGFLDVWTQENVVEDKKELVLLTEPQVWYNITNHLAAGTEIELSQNFLPTSDDFEIFPTLGIKWTF